MGLIYDRTQEHLGTTDAMVIRTLRKLLDAIRAHRDAGGTPPGVDKPELNHMLRRLAGSAVRGCP